jgi:hypothetical protein
MPFRDQAICRERTVQWAGRDSIHVWQISPGYGPEAHEIEVGILCNQGVERPLNQRNSACKGVFPLLELQAAANTPVPVTIQDGSHVRMEKRLAGTPARNGESESYELSAVKGAQDLPSGL